MCVEQTRLVIAAIVKNNARSIAANIRRFSRLAQQFGSVSFVVFENGSTDGTGQVLEKIGGSREDFHLLRETISPERERSIATVRHQDGRPCRLELIAYARNVVRDYIERNLSSRNAVLLFDGDIALSSLKGALEAVRAVMENRYDCISANGMTKWGVYRDAFAFRSEEHPFGPEFLGDYWWKNTRRKIQRHLPGGQLLPVYSAFGGAAVYRMSAYLSARYRAVPDAAFLEYHRSLELLKTDPVELETVSLEPIPNTNFLQPVVCEHVPFHYEMRSKGFDRMAIDTRWRLLFLD